MSVSAIDFGGARLREGEHPSRVFHHDGVDLCVSDTELFQVRDELLLNKGKASTPIRLELEFRTDILRKENTVYVSRFDQTHDAVPNIGVCDSRSEGWLTTEGIELDVNTAREQLLHEREVGGEWIGVADYDSAQVRSFSLEHVEDSRLFAQNCACMQRDRSTGDPAGSG